MVEEGLYSDLTLHARGGSIKVHWYVLTSLSPIFHTAFQRLQRRCYLLLPYIIAIPEMTIGALQLLVLLLYTISTKKRQPIMEVFQVATDRHFSENFDGKYKIVKLAFPLNATLHGILTLGNCGHWFKRCSDTHIWFQSRDEKEFHYLPNTLSWFHQLQYLALLSKLSFNRWYMNKYCVQISKFGLKITILYTNFTILYL